MVPEKQVKMRIWSRNKTKKGIYAMDNLEKLLNLEITVQTQLLKTSVETIKQAPEGYLSVRERPQETDFYQT